MAITHFFTQAAWTEFTGNQAIAIEGSPSAGDRMFIFAAWKDYRRTVTIDQGWTEITEFADGTTAAGSGTGSMKVAAFYKDHTGSESNPTLTFAGAEALIGAAVMIILRKGGSDAWDTPAFATAPAAWTTSNTTTAMTTNPGITAGDLCLAIVGIRDDSAVFTRPTTAIAATGISAWSSNYVESPANHHSTATGNDMAADLGYRIASTGTASTNPSVSGTISATESGSILFVRQRVSTVISKTLTAATETDAAIALSRTVGPAQTETIAAATETGAAVALSKTQAAQSKALVAAAESGAAQVLDFDLVSPDQQKTIVAASETDAAQALATTQAAIAKTVGQALEADTARPLSANQTPQTKAVVVATESDAAQALSASQTAQSKNLSAVAETDIAQVLTTTQEALERTLTPTSETNAAQALALTQEAQDVTLGIAGETDTAQALSVGADIHVDLTASTEADAAQPVSFTQGPAQTITITAATTSSVAVALTYSQAPLTRTLGITSELDTATALNVAAGSYSILPASSTNTAVALDYSGGSDPVPVTGHILLGPRGQLVGPTTGRIVI